MLGLLTTVQLVATEMEKVEVLLAAPLAVPVVLVAVQPRLLYFVNNLSNSLRHEKKDIYKMSLKVNDTYLTHGYSHFQSRDPFLVTA